MRISNEHGTDRLRARERNESVIFSKSIVRRAFSCAALFLLLLPPFTGCRSVPHMPDAEELLSVLQTAFVCGFTAEEAGMPAVPCALTRTADGDTLRVTMPHSTVTFSFSGGQTFLCAGGEADGGKPLSVPVTLPADTGAALWRSLFCMIPSADAAVTRTDDGYCVSDPASGILMYCSADGLPTRIVSGSVTITVTAFIPQGDQKS